MKLLLSTCFSLISLLSYSQRIDNNQNPFFVYVGKGTLLTQDLENQYRVAKFRIKGELIDFFNYAQAICAEETSCVGYQSNFTPSKQGYVQGALLFDAKKVNWPYKLPARFAKYGFENIGYSEGTSECIKSNWCGSGKPSLYKTSADKDYTNFLECFAKVYPLKNNGRNSPNLNWPKYYRLTTMFKGEGKSLGVIKDGKDYKVRLVTTNNSPEQYWIIEKTIGGYYHIKPMLKSIGGRNLIVTNDHEKFKLDLVSASRAQKLFQIEQLNNGYYRLTTLSEGEGKSLDIINDQNNNKLMLGNTGNYTGQYWKITELGSIKN